MDLKGRVAIVTGAAGAIGRGISRVLVGEGVKVVLADMARAQVEAFANEIKASGGSALAVEVDVTSREATKEMAQKTIEVFGQIDILVNNAGIIVIAPLIETKEEDWDKVMNVNLKGALFCLQAVAPYMIEKKIGRIINISSEAAKRPGILMGAYAATKHGLIGLTQVACQELGVHNITVNSICPGFVPSPMWSEHLSPAFAPLMGVAPDKVIETFAKANTPLQRAQTPEDIGEAVAYLAKADTVTGIALTVDSGYAMY